MPSPLRSLLPIPAITSTTVALIAAVAIVPAALAGPAVNQFEVKDLDVEQGELEVELQSDWASGMPRRKSVTEDGETEFDDNEIARQRHSLEVGFGLTDWLRFSTGVEWEEERIDDAASLAEANSFGDLELTEFQFEGQVVLIPVAKHGIGLGAYAELEIPRFGEARSLYFGPIVQAVSGPWSATGNFAFVKSMGGTPEEGEARDEKWDFAYFTQVKYELSSTWALALEAYGSIDRLGNSGTASEAARSIGDQDQHRIGPVVYYAFSAGGGASPSKAEADDDEAGGGDDDDEGTGVTLSAGVLFGLTDDTPDTTIKTGLEIEF